MSPAFEAFLVRLYVDAAARERFLRDPRREAETEPHLTAEEVDALARIDRTGLELAAASYAAKRRKAARPGRQGPLRQWISRLARRG